MRGRDFHLKSADPLAPRGCEHGSLWAFTCKICRPIEETLMRPTHDADGRLYRIKGSGDHNWEPWSTATLGRGRLCLDCGHRDDGYQFPCLPKKEKQ